MPFLPFVLLLAWQAISKSASFALGWATAIYFADGWRFLQERDRPSTST